MKQRLPLQQQPMLKTVEGIYQNGQIELTEIPQNVSDRVQVLVTFVDPSKIDYTKLRQLIDQLETIAGIQQGFEEVNPGQTRPVGDFTQKQFGITPTMMFMPNYHGENWSLEQ